jgi:hypothetical protein
MRFAKIASAKMDYFLQIILFIFLFWQNACICACVCVYMCVKYIYNFIKK